ncbi:MAG: helix-turn-helix transcriptional regulator [Clostridiaceae bacterium]|nr:helix-turn-helix transcriptional regulator [Clostridiaceae bacterium]
MLFSEKLQLLRKSKGWTQEDLAAGLNLARQTITKWESGAGFPDIANLIALSELFLVTVDYLVKDDTCRLKPRMIDPDRPEFVPFLLKAKKATYSGKGPECESSRPASHDLRFSEGDYLYIDTYLGGERFSGEEAVWYKGDPIFAMNYSGRVLDDRFSGDFLKAALSAVPEHMPFRGPEFFSEGDYRFRCFVSGDADWFQGYEEIFFGELRVYECFFHGGTVK